MTTKTNVHVFVNRKKIELEGRSNCLTREKRNTDSAKGRPQFCGPPRIVIA